MTSVAWRHASETDFAQSQQGSVWMEVNAWLALLPMLFITVGGWISAETHAPQFRLSQLGHDTTAQLITLVAWALLVGLLVLTKLQEILSVFRKARIFLVLPCLSFISIIWSQDPRHTFVSAVTLAILTLFAVYLYVRYPGERLLSFLTFAAAIALLMSAFAVIFVPSVGIDPYQDDAWCGVFHQRNNCAVACVCFIVIGLHCRVRDLAEHILRGTVLFLAIVFLVMTGSRTGWLITPLAVGAIYGLRLLRRMPWRDRLLSIVALAIPAAAVLLLLAEHFIELLAVMGKDPTMTQRTIIWLALLSPIAKHPLVGYGYSAFWLGMTGESGNTIAITGWNQTQSQNGYLDVMLQIGLLGLIPLVWMLARGLTQAARALNSQNSASVQMATVLLLVLMVENVGESGFLAPINILWFYTLIALLILHHSSKRAEVV
jgi:exopolysaccharide production protein ExoQ